MITSSFPTLKDEPETVAKFLDKQGLDIQLFQFAAEAVCDAVHNENPNLDIPDMVLGIRNNRAFRALLENGADFGILQHRSRGGKAYITNLDSTLKIMVHNTDAATGLGAHIPAFASKRNRRGTHYLHNESQAELEFGDDVIEFASQDEKNVSTTIDVCIFAEKVDGNIVCRLELLVDAQMNTSGSAFIGCSKRYGMKFGAEDFVTSSAAFEGEDDDFDSMVRPLKSQ